MKRYFLSFTAILLILVLAACAGNPGNTDSGDSTDIHINASETPTAYTVEEVGFSRDDKHIYGELYLPEHGRQLPLVIISHGFGGNHHQVESYAKLFAESGIAACAFDFIGGGSGSKSDGKTTEMSVLTEAADLNVVIDGLLARDDIDPSEIYLFGESQGGFVSTYVAGTRPNDIKGLIVLYPAYVLQDDAWERTPDPENIPETMNLMGTTIGRIYNEDAMSFDIYDVMMEYPGDVLIIHGTRDTIAPISYSERAATVFPFAELIRFEGAGHGFYGNDETRSAELSVDFVIGHLGSEHTGAIGNSDTANMEEPMKIRVTDGTNEVIFALNDTSTAWSLYDQLPLTIEVQDYSTNEKTFYPPEELDTSDVIESDGPFGTIAYFSPWGNVAMYYSACGEYPGLYIMGEAVEGSDNIEKLSGSLEITKVVSQPAATNPAVYFTTDISAEGLVKIYKALGWQPEGKVAVKISTGEPPASNYLRPELIGELVQLLDGTIVECNTAYGGSRASSAMHKQVAEDHGFTAIADFDLLDEEGEVEWPVTGGSRLNRAIVGSHAENYVDWVILSHFKGHAMAGFGGAIKNVAIGMSSPSGKVYVHTAGTKTSGSIMYSDQDAWLEALPEMVSGVVEHVGSEHIIYINVMNRLSVDCDCDGHPSEPDIHDIGILASTDPVALDQACIDLVYQAEGNASLVQRIESRNGLHALEHAEEIGLGSRTYVLLNIDD